MDLRQLRYFVILAEELHFGRAAERLGMTQPPLSQSIQVLEKELGVLLFARTKRSVALTPVGEQWLPHARKLLADSAELPEIAHRLALGATGSLRLAFVSIADYSVLPGIVSRYKSESPDVRISLREATSDVQIEALLEGEIDAGLIIRPGGPLHGSLDSRPLLRESLVLAVPTAWIEAERIADAERIRFAEVASEPLILFPRRSAPSLHDAITSYYAAHGHRPTIAQEAIQMQTIVSLVSAGMGVALVPESIRNLGRTGVRYLELAEQSPKIDLDLVWRRDATSPVLRRLVDSIAT